MTKEDTAEAIKVMQAYVDGEDIACTERFFSAPVPWVVTIPNWNWSEVKYRVEDLVANPCPVCGKAPDPAETGNKKSYWFQCTGGVTMERHHIETPGYDTKKEAISAWNRYFPKNNS